MEELKGRVPPLRSNFNPLLLNVGYSWHMGWGLKCQSLSITCIVMMAMYIIFLRVSWGHLNYSPQG